MKRAPSHLPEHISHAYGVRRRDVNPMVGTGFEESRPQWIRDARYASVMSPSTSCKSNGLFRTQ
jgi:hypothetical protein